MDLKTTYMGYELDNPLVVSASPLSESVDNIKRMEDAGAAGVVMFSLFEEQLLHEAAAMEHFMSFGTESFPEALSFFPEVSQYHVDSDRYLEILEKASEATQIPIFGSLNGVTDAGWIDYATKMEEAGAKGIELNIFYVPTDPERTGEEIETQYVEVLKAVKGSVKIPVALKLSPFFSSLAHVARRFDREGADALVIFNRFYQPDFDLDELDVTPNLSLSSPYEIRLPLLWIAILSGGVKASLAATTGVHGHEEVIKYIMAGADVVMTASALLKNGIGYIGKMLQDLTTWMEKKEYESVEQMKGSMSQRNAADPGAFERANYIRTLESFRNPYSP